MPDQVPYHYAVGRRKSAVATVRLVPGSGLVIVNGKPADEYFGRATLEYIVNQPLTEANLAAQFNQQRFKLWAAQIREGKWRRHVHTNRASSSRGKRKIQHRPGFCPSYKSAATVHNPG